MALIEGVSFLLLLGIAMPLKYLAGQPAAVKIVGWAHGILFVLFCLALAEVFFRERWTVWKAGAVFASALVPFGPFVVDRRFKAFD